MAKCNQLTSLPFKWLTTMSLSNTDFLITSLLLLRDNMLECPMLLSSNCRKKLTWHQFSDYSDVISSNFPNINNISFSV